MTAVDITEQKRREQALRALLREVAHRSKNLLAIIQSIATQTGRYSETVDDFLSRFRGRLQSLASTQDLVTSSDWRGAALQDLVLDRLPAIPPTRRSAFTWKARNPISTPTLPFTSAWPCTNLPSIR